MELAVAVQHAVSAVCPIYGVSIGHREDRATWRADFKPEATNQDRTNAQAAIFAFDLAAFDAQETAEAARLADIKQDAQTLDLYSRLKNATGTQIDSYVDANVTDLASVRTLFKKVLRLLALKL